MKKLFTLAFVALMSVAVFAQKGEKSFGGSLLLPLESGSDIGLSVRGQYGFTEEIRGEGSFDWHFTESGTKLFSINANAHYLSADVQLRFRFSDFDATILSAGVSYKF